MRSLGAKRNVITLESNTRFSQEIDELRVRYGDFKKDKRVLTRKDEFDRLSRFVTVYSGEQIIGTLRMTTHPGIGEGVAETWTRVKNLGRGVRTKGGRCTLELSRAVVHPDWRSRGIGGLMLYAALEYAATQNYEAVLALVENGHPWLEFFLELGFEEICKHRRLISYDDPSREILVRALRFAVTRSYVSLPVQCRIFSKLAANNILLVDDEDGSPSTEQGGKTRLRKKCLV